MNANEFATRVDEAAKNAQPIAQLSHESTFSVDEAYEIQLLSLQRRYARGEKHIGLKMGFTSEAKMKQMGVHDLIWGRLTDAMLIADGGELSFSGFIHPRAEPEICFRVSQDLDREVTVEEAPQYVDAVAAAIEVIDSRYQNFKFSLEDVIADNCSSAALVIGDWQPVPESIGDLAMTMSTDGNAVQSGSSAAILGDPWRSFAAATRLAEKYQQPIKAGDVIMAGAATPAIFLEQGQSVSVSVSGLGETGFKVV